MRDSANIAIHGKDTYDIPLPVAVQPRIAVLQSAQPIPITAPRRKEGARMDIQYYNSENGFPSSYLSCLLFTRDGAMWIGSQKGLYAFDGKFAKCYTSEQGLPDENITKLFEDSKGNLWIGTSYGGVAKYDGTYLHILDDNNGLSANNITAICEDPKGNMWFGMWGGGIAKYDGKTITEVNREHGLLEMRVLSVIADDQNKIWIATNGKGLYEYSGDTLIQYTKKSGQGDGYLISLFQDSRDRLWLGNWNHMAYLTADSNTHVNYANGPKLGQCAKIIEDSQGNIWMASMQNGVFRYNDKSVMNISEAAGLPSNNIVDVAEDPSGNLWFASGGGGLMRYNPNSFEYFDESSGLTNKFVNSISETDDGKIIFGTEGGLVFFDDTTFQRMYVHGDDKAAGGRVYDVHKTSSGDIWFSSLNCCVFKISGDTIKGYNQNSGVHDHNITAFSERVPGELWLGAWNVGLSRLNQNGFTVYNAKSGLHNFVITDLLTDKNQTLWIATDGEGITKYDGSHFTHLTENEGLASNHINAFFIDSFDNLWVLSKRGINLVRDGKIEPFELSSSLPDKDVSSAIQDDNGNFWIFTANGLLYLKLKEGTSPSSWNPENYESKLFTQFDGLLGTDFIPRCSFIDSKNRIWFGTGKGLMMKNLSSFDVTPKTPQVRLESIKLNGNFMDYNNLQDSIYDSLFEDFSTIKEGVGSPAAFSNFPSSLTLPPDANHLTFLFSAQSWHSDKIMFSYKLEGVDENWSLPSKDAWAEYRNLSHGNYIFKLKGIGESNAESAILEYPFTILPPWYHTWWARILFVIIFCGGVWVLIRLRTKQLQQKQIILEQKVQERTAELDIKNKELYSQKEEIERQHTLLEETHKEIKDSINYAKRIQEAILPATELVDTHFPSNFILYRPKDVVAGDFYWIHETANGVLFSASDCTGHGVPGAMVSVVCYNALNRAVREFGITSPEKVLDQTREIVLETFQLSNAQVNDGMDAALIHLGKANTSGERELLFSGANNTVSIIRNGEYFELEGDKQPIGNYKDSRPFSLHSFNVQKGDMIYLFTDGYADQFGGPKGKKLKSKVLKELLVSVSHLALNEQREKLNFYLDEWKGDLEQLDDISVFGFKI